VKRLGPTLALLVAALAGGCSDPANTQYLPIGSRCSSATQCGTSPYDCAATGYPFGYCEKPCTTDGDCPLDSLCAPAPVNECRRVCTDDSACRVTEGYRCLPVAGRAACEPGPSVDGGTPSG
jgi:hypothetical protein